MNLNRPEPQGLHRILTADEARKHFVPAQLHRACAAQGVTLRVDPQFGYSGHIERADGTRSQFMGTAFDINGQGASALAKDKDYAARLLGSEGFPVPEGVLLFSPSFKAELAIKNPVMASSLGFAERALDFAARHGFPLFLKPNEGSGGQGVAKVSNLEELFETLAVLFATEETVLLQTPATGKDFRILVLDGTVMAAYERSPFTVLADGTSSVSALASAALDRMERSGRPANLKADDPRIVKELLRQGLSPASVPPAGQRVVLTANANLSSGGEAVDHTDNLHPSFRDVAVNAAAAAGLRLCGVDIMAASITDAPEQFWIIEINSAPGLRNFAATSPQALARVEGFFDQLVAAIAKG